ncbi:hypothetical protein [Polaribacter sp. P097]|uniref:hypothetical protein n=1 Tax=Polaribacter sp. P097 TaxID=3117398 RepID=UPI002FE25702
MKIKAFNYLLICGIALSIISCKTDIKSVDSQSKEDNCYPNNDRPSQAITYPEMASMFKEYDNGQKIVLDEYIAKKTKGRDSIATISQFFSIDELKQYIAYIEKLSEEKEIALTGVKIFTAAYPSDYKIEEYQNRVSFILMPTANIGDQKNVAYEPLKSGKGKPVSMQSILNKYADETTRNINRASVFSINLRQDEPSSGLNRGTVFPPHDD